MKYVFKLNNGLYLSEKRGRVQDCSSRNYMRSCSDTTPDLQEARVFTGKGPAASAARQALLTPSDGRAVPVGLTEQELPL